MSKKRTNHPETLFRNLKRGLFMNGRGWRLLLGFVCVLCLALFLHFREVRLEVLELNATANRYIVAQVDFEFSDYETTIFLKQQAIQNIGSIYRIDGKRIRLIRYELEDRLIHTKEWHEQAPASTYDEMDRVINELEALLRDARFTDARTIKMLKELEVLDHSYYEYVPEKTAISLPPEIWGRLSSQIKEREAFHPETIAYCEEAFRKEPWELQKDEKLERSLRIEASKTVSDTFKKIYAGTRLVEPGERITSRHLTMMQAMKTAISDSRKLSEPLTIVASFLLSLIFVAISTLYFRMFQPAFLRSLQQLSLFICIVLLTLLFAKLTEHALLKSESVLIERIRYPIIAPFATMLICILLSSRIALFAAAFLSIILSVSLAVDHSRFLILNLITSIIVVIYTRHLSQRKEVFKVALKTWIGSIFVLYAFSLSENLFWGSGLLIDIGSSLFFLMVIAVLVVGLLPALEMIFRVPTDMTLIEYMDPNNELLQMLAREVPGTYQHSLVVGNLSEACAQAIGANGLLCRAATLYHDIGKIMNPQFYTENQQTSVNIHQLLTPQESAQVIISHVIDGEMLARKYRLPQSFIDMILQHHGTTLVYYFYRKQLELAGGHVEQVDILPFRYPGPKPQTKEAAIIMICDSIEAASRSLEDTSEPSLHEMINRLVSEKAEDGQFDECDLTFEELSCIKQALVKSLLLTNHVRIKYPKKEKLEEAYVVGANHFLKKD